MTIICPCCLAENSETHEKWSFCPICLHKWIKSPLKESCHYYQELKNRNNIKLDRFQRKLKDRFNAIEPLLKKGVSSILEVGCAEGQLGQRVKDSFNVSYDGIEISNDAMLAEKTLDHVYRTTASTLKDVQYDLILSFHVLEHIADISAELKQWHRLLSETGALLVEVPNKAGHHLLIDDHNPEHLHQFTLQSLTCLLGHEGFEVYSASTGHFESEVYSDSIRVIAKRAITDEEKSNLLIERFKQKLTEPFIVYGIGGDFMNYIYPYIKELQVSELMDSSPNLWGRKIADKTVKKFNKNEYDNSEVLVASIRYQSEIIEHLLGLGISIGRITTLSDIYD